MSTAVAPRGIAHQIIVVYCGLVLAVLLGALDSTIVATALPTIVSELGGLQQLSWVVTASLLAQTVAPRAAGHRLRRSRIPRGGPRGDHARLRPRRNEVSVDLGNDHRGEPDGDRGADALERLLAARRDRLDEVFSEWHPERSEELADLQRRFRRQLETGAYVAYSR